MDRRGRARAAADVTAVYLFGTVLVVLIVAVIIAPIVEERGRSGDLEEGDGRDATDRQEEALEALRRLEFDFLSGKVDERDYGPLRSRYAALAIAARDELAQADTESKASVVLTCAGCGAALPGSEKFCTACGRAVTALPIPGA